MSQDTQASPAEERLEKTSPKARKWWRDSRYIAAIGAALAGVASFNPALNNWLTYNLESTKQETSRRDAYLDRAIDPQRNPTYRLSVLEFLVKTLPERDTMWKWAKEQRDRILADLELEKEKLEKIEKQKTELERMKNKIASEIIARQQALSRTKPTSPQRKKAEQEIEKLKGQVDELKIQLDKAVKAAADLRPAPHIVNPSPPIVDNGATQKKSDKKPTEDQTGSIVRSQGECCITCNGLTICGVSVTTDCGSCEGTR